MRTCLPAFAMLALATLAGCGDPGGSPGETASTPPGTGSPGSAASINGTVGGDGSTIRLGSLDGAAIQDADLTGELACGFGASGAAPLLIARGDVASPDRARAVVSHNGYVERLVATEPGGYNAMIGGVRFGGRGLTVTIAPAGAAPSGGGESLAVPATLTIDRGDGARRVIRGTWTCGP